MDDKVQESLIIGQLLLSLEYAQDFFQGIVDHFYEKTDEDEMRVEGDDVRTMIRLVDSKLADAHCQQLAAYVGVHP